MSVKNTHSDYNVMAGKWQRCRDVCAGQDAMRERTISSKTREAYIPKLKDQTPDEYDAYVNRSPFYNASWRTVTGLNGMLFRKQPKVTAPDAVTELLKDVGMCGLPFFMLAEEVGTESLQVGRVGVFVDYPTAPAGATLADSKALNLRPTMCTYRAENIINWKQSMVNNVYSLIQVVLQENATIVKDEFTTGSETNYRVLDLVEGKYRVRLFRINDKNEDEQIGGDMFPVMGGKPLDYIPFVFIGVDDISPEVDEPPLIDLVDMNVSHWRSTADYEHGCHYAGLPTPVVSGYRPANDGDKLYIGSATAWIFPDPNAKATFLEFTGAGLEPLKENIADKETRMAVLGARMLEKQIRGVESAETASIHRAGEQSMLGTVAETLSLGLAQALRWFVEWAGADPTKVEVNINKDFYPMAMDAQKMAALVAAWQSGAISFQTMFANLQQAEVIDATTTIEEEQTNIENDPVRMAMQPPPMEDPNLSENTGAQAGGTV